VEDEQLIWICLDNVFRDAGFTLWTHLYLSIFNSPGRTYPPSSGFGYAQTDDPDQVGTVRNLQSFQFPVCKLYSILPLPDIHMKNGLSRPARTRDGLDVVIRVIVIGNEGHDHLKILRDNKHPDSLRTMKISFTRPRVYLIDFEVAIQFPPECLESERVLWAFLLAAPSRNRSITLVVTLLSLLLDLPIILLSLMFGN
jgi:hypothetical protein